MPGGMKLIGNGAQDVHHSRHIRQILPPDFGDGTPVKVDTPPGIVTAMIKRIPDGFALAAFQGFTFQITPGAAG